MKTAQAIAAALLSPLLALAVATSAAAQDGTRLAISKDSRTIAITATDQVLHRAEIGTVHIGFTVYGATKDAAYQTASQTSNAIINTLAAAGVQKDSVSSDTQSITVTQFFNQETPPDQRRAHAFTAQQSWSVRTRADDAARVLDIAVKAGANQSGQIDWSLQDANAAQNEAAAKAIQRARSQAAAMASGLGVTLGPLLYASNQVEAAPVRPVPMMAAKARTEQQPAPLAINAREIETSATVYAVFALQ